MTHRLLTAVFYGLVAVQQVDKIRDMLQLQ